MAGDPAFFFVLPIGLLQELRQVVSATGAGKLGDIYLHCCNLVVFSGHLFDEGLDDVSGHISDLSRIHFLIVVGALFDSLVLRSTRN